ncbi:unnamed protein product [Effrenium voratum]|uniref:Pentatricopeptide repeat-containing protein, chloroplastic n=1 Tax=Effrenium voratum TaxID=2562239 RepID=A0AA36HP15_9DINO|nr:unnamed protein product [Effrenium voratum]
MADFGLAGLESASQQEALRLLEPSLQRWRERPQLATAPRHLPRLPRLPRVAAASVFGEAAIRSAGYAAMPQAAFKILRCMSSRALEVNHFHLGAAVMACEKASAWQMALSLSREGDAVARNSAVSACTKAGEWPRCLRLLAQADVVTYSSAMGGWHLSSSLLERMQGEAVQPNAFTCSSAIASVNEWRGAVQIIRRMQALRVKANKVVWSACIASHSKWQNSCSALLTMRRSRIPVNDICQNAAITSCAEAKEWRHSMQLFASPQLSATPVSFSALMTSFSQERWQFPLSLFSELCHCRLDADAASTSTAMSSWTASLQLLKSRLAPSHAAMACAKAGAWRHAVLHEMRAARLASAVPAISACAKASRWEWALHVLATMGDASDADGVGAVCFGAAMSACERGGQWAAALGLLAAAEERRVRLDGVIFNTLISAARTGGRWHTALGLVSAMRSAALEPEVVACNAAISALDPFARWAQAAELLAQSRRRWLEPDVISCNAIISCHRHRWTLAISCLAAMAGFPPSSIAFDVATQALRQSEHWGMAVAQLERMTQLRLKADVLSYNAAITACEKNFQWKAVLCLLMETSTAVGEAVSQLYETATCAASSLSTEERTEMSWRLGKLSQLGLPGATLNTVPTDATLTALCTMVWSAASAFDACEALAQAVEQRFGEAWTLSGRSLANLAWGLATLNIGEPKLYLLIQGEVLRRGRELIASKSVLINYASCLVEVLWACSFAGLASASRASEAHDVLDAIGQQLDDMCDMCDTCVPRREPGAHEHAVFNGPPPRVVMDLPDKLVLFKPPGWQVDDLTSEGRPLSAFLRSSLPRHRQLVLEDVCLGLSGSGSFLCLSKFGLDLAKEPPAGLLAPLGRAQLGAAAVGHELPGLLRPAAAAGAGGAAPGLRGALPRPRLR